MGRNPFVTIDNQGDLISVYIHRRVLDATQYGLERILREELGKFVAEDPEFRGMIRTMIREQVPKFDLKVSIPKLDYVISVEEKK